MDNPKKVFVFVDHEKYEWEKNTITGAELRLLASIPDNAEIFLEVPGKPDQQVNNQQVIDLEHHHGPARFSTQSPGSQAG
jgi:hypothetical protein